MGMHFSPLTRHIGAEVSGVNLREPLSNEQIQQIHDGMDRFAVLVFHNQELSDEQHIQFSSSFGPLEGGGGAVRPGARLASVFADISNLDEQNRLFGRESRRRLYSIGSRLWHSDFSYKPVPAKYSMLRSVQIPTKGGNTEFAHMGAAYEALDEETKLMIEDMVCEHSQITSRGQIGFTDFTPEEREKCKPVLQRLVRTLPRTGRKSLYLSSHAGAIVGLPKPEALLLLRDLYEHATQREFVYSHQWQVSDLVMWDNRQTMHRGRPYPADQARDMRRLTVRGDGPTVEQNAV